MKPPAKLYRFRPLSDKSDLLERELETLRQSYLYAPSFSQMNDPMEAFYTTGGPDDQIFDALFSRAGLSTNVLHKPFKEMVSRFGLVSFSASHLDLPMWAYYGSKFSGMCLEFDTENLTIGDFQGEHLVKVNYAKSAAPPITVSGMLGGVEPLLISRLARKRVEWRHEKEWRYITGCVGRKHYLDDALTKVYLGPRVSDKHADAVCQILKNRPVEVMKGETLDFALHFHTLQQAAPLGACERVGRGLFDPANDLYPESELQVFLEMNYVRLIDECRKTALRPNLEGVDVAGISSDNSQLMYLTTRYKLRSGREVFHQRYFNKQFKPASPPRRC
ncbi:DUF2971 domain-containing protein [Pseudomonas sp. S9]|uniref:DUF2971 domain-containing protein n=1 Tax=Pseudomonas sp. S9 TaxID=686578 RepID=UPI000255764B|nr:DUF2971 domain-containing protein [Pseudomonas sp. S9]